MAKTDVQLKLLAVGITQRQVAQELALSELAVFNTVRYKRHNQIIQDEVAKLLGLDAADLWGKHYGPTWRQTKKRDRAEQNDRGKTNHNQE